MLRIHQTVMERSYDFNASDEPIVDLPPGFRFHPTDEELLTHYLFPKVVDNTFTTTAIGDVDLNKVEPWDLPWKAKIGEKEWYFFCVRDRKYPSGSRTNRATEAGYWKATGKDKEIFRAKISVGMKKTLVFYKGRAPRGEKTNWVMHEYRLQGKNSIQNIPKTSKKEWVLCRIFKKNSGGKKVHISGLTRGRDTHLDLPPLIDISSDENRTTEGSHVTCFSNPTQDSQHKSFDEYNSFSNKDFPNSDSIFSSHLSSCIGNFHHPDSALMQDESMLRLFLESNSPCIKQTTKTEFSEDIGINADTSSVVSNHQVGFKPFDEDQDFPIIPAGPTEFDCLWNY